MRAFKEPNRQHLKITAASAPRFVTTIARAYRARARRVSDRFGHENCVILRNSVNKRSLTVSANCAVCRGKTTLNAQNREIAQLGSTPVRAANELEERCS